jgi:hypothetical protein
MKGLVRTALVAALAIGLSGCTYDYEQHTDRVAYSAGDAVRANLEAETINPYKRSVYRTEGLGANGNVIASGTTASAPTTTSSSTQTVSTAN